MNDIRFATKEDLDSIAEIYHYAIEAEVQTGHQQPLPMDYWLNWIQDHAHDLYPAWVVFSEGHPAGFAALSPYRKGRTAFDAVAEVSYYVHPAFFRLGLGKALLENAEKYALSKGVKTILAIVISANAPSISLLEYSGYSRWGVLPQVVKSRSGVYDHYYYGKKLNG